MAATTKSAGAISAQSELRRFYLKRHAAAADLSGIDPDEALDMSEVQPHALAPALPLSLPSNNDNNELYFSHQ